MEASLGYTVRLCLKANKQANQSSSVLPTSALTDLQGGWTPMRQDSVSPTSLPCPGQRKGHVSSCSFEKRTNIWGVFGFQKLHGKEFYQFQKRTDKIAQ